MKTWITLVSENIENE